jgi:hypothetical protein
MITQIATFAGGLGLYLLVCAISVAAGMGLVRLLRVRLPRPSALVLAPVLTLAFWSVFLGFGVPLGVPVRQLTPLLWALTLGLALYGVGRPLLARRFKGITEAPQPDPAASAAGTGGRGCVAWSGTAGCWSAAPCCRWP